ncbi:MAG: aminoglycoside phosphotransferase family protein [Chloroflexi bacterium]|nr:aminoglycoside phosphotransferase family protein [Chloroflexota bacterium]
MTRPNLDALTGDYGHRLGRLTGAQLQAAVDRFDLGGLRGAAPIPGGQFGQNVHVTTESGAWILRGCPHYDWQFPKERFFARQIATRSRIRAPWPYLIEPSRGIFGWSFALMPCLPGLQLADPAVRARQTPAEATAIARALGTGLTMLHELTWTHAGAYAFKSDDVVPYAVGHRERVLGEIDDLVSQCGRLDSLSDSDLHWLRRLLKHNQAALDVSFQPTFVHHDFTTSNVVVNRSATAWNLSGVFDLMEAYVGDPEEDLVRALYNYSSRRPGLARDFLRAYVSRKPLREDATRRLRLYMLRDCLVIWEFGHRFSKQWVASAPGFRVWAQPYVGRDLEALSGGLKS